MKGQDRKLLSFNRKALRMGGIFPPENLSESPTKRILFILHLIFWYCLFTVMYTGEILATYHFWNNMEIIAFVLVALLGSTMIQLEVIYARMQSSSIVKVLEFLENYVNSKMEEMDLNENHIQIIEKAKVKARRISVTMIVCSEIMVACWSIFPFTRKYLREHNSEEVLNVTTAQNEYRWLDFCFIIWAPFDITVSPYYEITCVLQMMMFTTNIAHWKIVETTIMTLIIYTSAHLKVLETFLSEMKISLSIDSENAGPFTTQHSVTQLDTAESNQEYLPMDGLENNGFKNEKQKHRDFIVNFVNYHEAITEFVHMVNTTFAPVLFISFFFCQILACLTLFQTALTELNETSLVNLIICMIITSMHFIFCWYGNEVFENSQLLRQAAFESSLAQNSREFKHFILMVMKNSQKPLVFSALGFYKLSLDEFLKTMNAAYAYFNILKKLNGNQ